MIFYPKAYFQKVSDISIPFLCQNNIKGLMLDVDNTLINFYRQMTDETVAWIHQLKEHNIKLCIVSNSNKKEKVEMVAKKLQLEYIYWAMKPLKKGFKKAKTILELPNHEIAVVGDQMFTDVLGAKKMKMFAILVEPIEKKDIWVTVLKRPIENHFKKKFIKTL